jgi:hypothetical protein
LWLGRGGCRARFGSRRRCRRRSFRRNSLGAGNGRFRYRVPSNERGGGSRPRRGPLRPEIDLRPEDRRRRTIPRRRRRQRGVEGLQALHLFLPPPIDLPLLASLLFEKAFFGFDRRKGRPHSERPGLDVLHDLLVLLPVFFSILLGLKEFMQERVQVSSWYSVWVIRNIHHSAQMQHVPDSRGWTRRG